MNSINIKILLNFIFNIPLFLGWFIFIILLSIFSPNILRKLFQNKYYKPINEASDEEKLEVENLWIKYANEFNVEDEYQEEFIETLKYFSKFDTDIIYNSKKSNPVYRNVYLSLHTIFLAKEAIEHLNKITKDDKRVAYYESNKKASLDDLVTLYDNKLKANNEDKISTKSAKKELRIRKFIVKLKKYDTLFINFFLLFYVLNPISSFKLKKEEIEYIELLEDLFDFFRTGHATKKQIHKSVAIQLYNRYKSKISEIKLDSKTTDEKLKEYIGKLIDLTLQTDKPYTNFNKIDEEAYVKNIVYNFPVFECDNKLSEKQIRRFKFYFTRKSNLVPRYIPQFLRRWVLDKFLKTPLSFYATQASLNIFGLKQRKIK